MIIACGESTPETKVSEKNMGTKIPVLFDTDANNELDDQHAMAYLFFNGDVFDVVGVTVNGTRNGGDVEQHRLEAERIIKLCGVSGKFPLYAGANGNFEEIKLHVKESDYDGKKAVDFIISEAKKERDQKLVLVPVGKLTNIALALAIAPEIKENVRVVWLGSNYPEPGEYNLVNDIPSMNYVLAQDVPFEMVMVRYGKPSGSDAVKVTPAIIESSMQGKGPKSQPVIGRDGNTYSCFGDYSIGLFQNIDLHGDPPGRALFDMVAVAILKNPSWGERYDIPAPTMEEEKWVEQSDNSRKITIWENFIKEAILDDFFDRMENYVLVE